MVLLAHEVWEDADSHSFEFGLPHPTKDAFRKENAPNARLRKVIFAASYNDGMRSYYEWQGWGEYNAVAEQDTIYTEAHLQEQKALRPTLYC